MCTAKTAEVPAVATADRPRGWKVECAVANSCGQVTQVTVLYDLYVTGGILSGGGFILGSWVVG